MRSRTSGPPLRRQDTKLKITKKMIIRYKGIQKIKIEPLNHDVPLPRRIRTSWSWSGFLFHRTTQKWLCVPQSVTKWGVSCFRIIIIINNDNQFLQTLSCLSASSSLSAMRHGSPSRFSLCTLNIVSISRLYSHSDHQQKKKMRR